MRISQTHRPVGASRSSGGDARINRLSAKGLAIPTVALLALLTWSTPAQAAKGRDLTHGLLVVRAAARWARTADRSLVSGAVAYRDCKLQRRARCWSYRRALQRAGRADARAQRRLNRTIRRTGGSVRRARSSRATSKPSLTAEGNSLRWTRVGRAHAYIVERSLSGQSASYELVRGSTFTPPPLPGEVADYRVRAAGRDALWSNWISISYPQDPIPPNPQAAPVLTVSGTTLQWTAVPNVQTYVLAAAAPNGTVTYSEVGGTSAAPTPAPGETITYTIRTAVDGSAWSAPVQISFPSAVQAPSNNEGTPVPAAPEKPPATERPSASEPPPATETGQTFEAPRVSDHFEVGLVPESLESHETTLIKELGAHTVRMEAEIEAPASQLAPWVTSYASAGIRILPLAGFEGRIPTSAQARNLATWAAAYGPGGTFWKGNSLPESAAITNIEFGNETSYAYQFSNNSPEAVASRAQEYALRFKEAAEAIHAANPRVGLLAQADEGDSGSSIWVDNMFKAVPNLAQYVAGWTIHPYGPEWETRMNRLVQQTEENGAPNSIPIYVTEWGLATDNGQCLTGNYGWNRCMTYAEAATTLSRVVAEMRARYGSRLAAIYLYQAQDQSEPGVSDEREQYFGVLQNSGAPKGAYTAAVSALLNENP